MTTLLRTRTRHVADQLIAIEEALMVGDWPAAVKANHAALQAAPDDPHALHASGRLFELADQPQDALSQWIHAVALDPTISAAWSAIGTLLARGVPIDNPHAFALLAFHRACQADPTWLMPAWHTALLYHALGHQEAAIAATARCFEVLRLHGDDPKNGGVVNLHNRSYLLLTLGRFEEGFRCYEYRLADVGHAMGERARVRPPEGVPRWTHGELTKDARLAVFVEQGAGDMFMTLRYVAALAQQGVRVTLEMFPSMSGVLRHRFVPQDGVTFIGQDAPLPEPVDAFVWAMSLPGLMRDAYTERVLVPSAILPSDRRLVAFCWQGSRSHRSDRIRSMPVEQLRPLAQWCRDRGYTPVAINPGEPAPDLDDPGEITSFAETAALLDDCAAVVSVDTALVHLAGCLGVPTFAMLAALPDWRWGLHDQGHIRWYESVTLVRQPIIGDWASVVADVQDRLGFP